MMIDYHEQWRAALAFVIGCVVFALLNVLPIFGEQSYIQNPELHLEIRQTIYWASVGFAFYFLHKSDPKQLFSNLIVSLFGPVVVLTLGFTRLLYILFPIK
jgi:uncharacterized membrane protein YoaK (UPF0700 family)